MPGSIWDSEVQATLNSAKSPVTRSITLDDQLIGVPPPFPSPEDWRDQWIYFLLFDRFNNPLTPPRQLPYDTIYGEFQGGTFNGVRQQLPYLKELGVGAIWLSPVLKNCQYLQGTYHGYGIQDFLRVEPRFASSPNAAEQELRALIDEAHALGMYIIFDIVLNHTGDVFAYQCPTGDSVCQNTEGSEATYSNTPHVVLWRDEHGNAQPDWTIAETIENPPLDATVWPSELRHNAYFRRQGLPQSGGDETIGDFASLKQMLTSDTQLQTVLIYAYQYLIAKYDIDGFRIDTLKYINRDFARLFGNAMREFGLSTGKKNFFTFGEVYDNEEKIAGFIGRNTVVTEAGDIIGVDAALDFPLFYRLPSMSKGFMAPSEVVSIYENRKQVEHDILSSHGDASNFFVTFLDNHDQTQRFYYQSEATPHLYDDQITLGIACLFSLQGIPCLYYGTEQGLHGNGNVPEAVREALWGKPDAFDRTSPFFEAVKQIALLRSAQPALRYGRQYFRPLSSDQKEFAISSAAPGVLAFSRILNDEEIIVVANTDTQHEISIFVIIDDTLHPIGNTFQVLFSNKPAYTQPGRIEESERETIVHEVNGSVSQGPIHFITVTLQPMEIQILGTQ
jgi:glycosidase